MVPVVTDTTTGQTNAHGAFIDASNGNPVPQAGKFYNGANVDYGPSDLSVPQNLTIHGIVQLPHKFEISDIFRAQSGFAYSRGTNNPVDADGDGLYNGQDLSFVRNSFRAPTFVDMDIRVAKNFEVGERMKLDVYFEMFNLFNSANPAAMENIPDQPAPLDSVNRFCRDVKAKSACESPSERSSQAHSPTTECAPFGGRTFHFCMRRGFASSHGGKTGRVAACFCTKSGCPRSRF